jgi:hypothetical protein
VQIDRGERANQRAAQKNYYTEPDIGVTGFVLLTLCCFLAKESIANLDPPKKRHHNRTDAM